MIDSRAYDKNGNYLGHMYYAYDSIDIVPAVVTINGKTYYFNEDGEMRYGWYEDSNNDVFYLGGEDEGWRAESQWLWLALPDEDEVDRNSVSFCDDDSTCSVPVEGDTEHGDGQQKREVHAGAALLVVAFVYTQMMAAASRAT